MWGSEGTFSTRLTVQAKEVSGDSAVVEWSTDGGKVWDKQGPTLTLSSDKDTRIKLWARVRSGDPGERQYASPGGEDGGGVPGGETAAAVCVGADGDRDRQDLHLQGDDQPAVQRDGRGGGEGVLHPAESGSGWRATRRSTRRMQRTDQEAVDTTHTAWDRRFREQGGRRTHLHALPRGEYVWPRFGMQGAQDGEWPRRRHRDGDARPIGFSGKLEEAVYSGPCREGGP